MKEYIAETGGRYTYSDDILNLQELTLSMSAIFEGCSGFIISGCEISGNEISPGYVWINGKVRHFSGCPDAVFPYYIYEKNSYDTVVYANEVNKCGRCNYLCLGGSAIPATPDAVTGLVPGFIELKPDYSPRLIDRFFGKYALLPETPFAKQTVNQTEGYVLVSDAIKELNKKANLLLDNYNNDQKAAVAGNLNVYQKPAADAKFAAVSSSFQDYITSLVGQGKTTEEAQKTLRDKLNAPGKEDVTNNYLRRDGKLSDLVLANSTAQKEACQKIGAAYAAEYQTKLVDTGWLQMANSGNSTDTSRLFIRQIGNIVCIQGVINTAKKDGSNWGGTIAVIPNQISPPKYGLRISYADYNDDHKYNRGASFIIQGNTRKILIYESGWLNINTEINFTYMI